MLSNIFQDEKISQQARNNAIKIGGILTRAKNPEALEILSPITGQLRRCTAVSMQIERIKDHPKIAAGEKYARDPEFKTLTKRLEQKRITFTNERAKLVKALETFNFE